MSNHEKILKFLGYRLVRFIILLIAIIIISFIMVDLSPINPVKTYISNMIVSPEQVAALEAYWGVNEPITAKIMNWLGNIIHGDLGNSLIFRIPVIDVIKEKFSCIINLNDDILGNIRSSWIFIRNCAGI